MTTVLHTADTHLGYRQYNSPERRADFMAAFEAVLEAAVERDVDAVVHAGDIFHDRRPGLSELLGTVSALRTLESAGIPFLAIVGNHEDKREAQWLDLFETLGLATRLDAAGTVVGDVTFYGLDYVPRSKREDLEYRFEPPETEHAALVAHGQFEPLAVSVRGSAWDLAAVLASATVDFDAALLGDEHQPDTARVDGTWATYAGSTERTSATEREDRGYNVVTFDGEVDVRRGSLETRPFVFVDVALAGDEGTERVRGRVGEHDLADAVVVVTVEGEGGTVTAATVEEFARERGALVARVNDRRELETEEEVLEVSFADPDEAVRERVTELGLSPVARTVDEAVRAGDLADSTVRSAVAERVESRMDDLAAFEPASAGADDDTGTPGRETDDGDASSSGAEEDPADGGEVADVPDDDEEVAEADAPDDAEEVAEADAPDDADAAADEREESAVEPADDGVGDGSSSTDDDADTTATPESSDEGADPATPDSSDDGDQQASMEEYL